MGLRAHTCQWCQRAFSPRAARCSHQVQTRSQINFGALAWRWRAAEQLRQSRLQSGCLRNLWVASAISSVLPALVLLSPSESLSKPQSLAASKLSPSQAFALADSRSEADGEVDEGLGSHGFASICRDSHRSS